MSTTLKARSVLEREDRRYLRAQALAAHTMHAIDKFMNDDVRRRDVEDALIELFMAEGVEILTDYARSEFGLPSRDHKGWTAEEVLALERKRLELMIRPIPQFILNRP